MIRRILSWLRASPAPQLRTPGHRYERAVENGHSPRFVASDGVDGYWSCVRCGLEMSQDVEGDMLFYGELIHERCQPKRRGRRIPIGAPLLCLALSACDLRANVLVLGDSIAMQSAGFIQFQLVSRETGELPVFNAVGGATIGFHGQLWVDRIADIRARIAPDLVVVSLGTNDAIDTTDPNAVSFWRSFAADPDANVERIIRALPNVPVIWLMPPSACGSYDRGRTNAVRAAIQRVAQRHANVRLPDTNGIRCAAGNLDTDGVHPTEAGEMAIGMLVRQELDRILGVAS